MRASVQAFVGALKDTAWIVLAMLVVVGVTTWTAAKPTDLPTFKQLYSPKDGTALASAACLTCHAKMPPTKTDLNPYGVDVQKAAAGRTVDSAVLKKIEKLDSDKDTFSNLDEIKAGTLPGDPKSKPAK